MMARKFVEENERIKRAYLIYLREAEGNDPKTIDKEAAAIQAFEESTKVKPFKKFHIDQAIAFKDQLSRAKSKRTKKPLSARHIDGTLRAVKAFFLWLAGQPGYKRAVRRDYAEYFNLNAKDSRIAHAVRNARRPTLAQCAHVFRLMPETTVIERRNKAVFACLMITAPRIGALASFRLKHVDLRQGCIEQDAREVRTKFSKTFTSWFFPVDPMYRAFFESWVRYLMDEELLGHDDYLFPKAETAHVDGHLDFGGLSREPYSDGQQLGKVIQAAFVKAGLPPFTAHSFRRTLVKLGDDFCASGEERKAWAQNLGHENVTTSYDAYLPVSYERQGSLIRKLAKRKPRSDEEEDD